MHQFLSELKQRVRVGVVGGSDLDKIKEQLGDDGVYNKYLKYKCKYMTKNIQFIYSVHVFLGVNQMFHVLQ